jgi:hypothetical protein
MAMIGENRKQNLENDLLLCHCSHYEPHINTHTGTTSQLQHMICLWLVLVVGKVIWKCDFSVSSCGLNREHKLTLISLNVTRDGVWISSRVFGHSRKAITNNYDSLIELRSPKVTANCSTYKVFSVFASRLLVRVLNGGHSLTLMIWIY